MIHHRQLVSLLSLFAMPVLFAASATVGEIKGKVTTGVGDTFKPAAVGQSIDEGTLIETGADSSLSITLPDGSLVTIGAGSRLRFSITNGQLQIVLLRGVLTGAFSPGATIAIDGAIVSTAGGVASVGGTTSNVSYADGTLAVSVATGGPASVKPVGITSPRIVPAGNSVTVSPSGKTNGDGLTPEAVQSIASRNPVIISRGSTPPVAGTPANPPAEPHSNNIPELTKIIPISNNGPIK